jgi:hypothetical protein
LECIDVIGHLSKGKNIIGFHRKVIISKGEPETFPVFDRFSQLQNSETMGTLLSEFTESG